MKPVRLVLAMALAAVPFVGAAGAADFPGGGPAVLLEPTICANERVLAHIRANFEYSDERYLGRDLEILDFSALRPNPVVTAAQTELIARDYCQGRVTTSDGHTRSLWYVVKYGMGFASIGDKVQYCIAGLDPWRVYGADCDSLR